MPSSSLPLSIRASPTKINTMTDNELIIEQLKKALFEAYLDSFYGEYEAKEKVALHCLLDDAPVQTELAQTEPK